MRRAACALALSLLIGAGPALAAEESDMRIEAGARIGSVAVSMILDEAVYRLGEPDSYDEYESGGPKRFAYDGQQLYLAFNDLDGEDDVSTVTAISTRNPGYADVHRITVGSTSGQVVEAYGSDYERLDEGESWSLRYPHQGISFDFEKNSDLVSVIIVYAPTA